MMAHQDVRNIGILNHVRFSFFEDSSEEETVLEKVYNYAECTVPHMSDKQFEQNFRIKPDTFENLLSKINQVRVNSNFKTSGYPRVALEKELMITVWYIGNLESFRQVAERFGISRSTCWDVVYRTCNFLLEINKTFQIIKWPSIQRQQEISHHFQQKGIPGIVGCIDGSHIKINAPVDNANAFINRKNYHSVLLQGVCDHKKMFIDVYAGEAGSIHDYTLYKRSDLYERITNNEIVFHNDSHMIGDLAYKLSRHLLVGFKNNGRLDERQRNFNYTLNRTRVIIEHSFALLKGRFRRLKFLEAVRLDLVSLLIISACILHNIALRNNDLFEGVVDLEAELREEQEQNPLNLQDIDEEEESRLARIKREDIVNSLRITIQ